MALQTLLIQLISINNTEPGAEIWHSSSILPTNYSSSILPLFAGIPLGHLALSSVFSSFIYNLAKYILSVLSSPCTQIFSIERSKNERGRERYREKREIKQMSIFNLESNKRLEASPHTHSLTVEILLQGPFLQC